MAESDNALLDEFLDAFLARGRFIRNTLESYRSDLQQFGGWLAKNRTCNNTLVFAAHSDLLAFLAQKVSAKVKASTTSRQLSSLKRFYRFLLQQGRIKADPSLNIDSPKLSRNLPASLTEEEVEALLDAPDVKQPLGMVTAPCSRCYMQAD